MSAKQALEDLQNNTAEALAQAKLDLVDAQETYDDAKNAVVTDNMTRCDQIPSRFITNSIWISRINWITGRPTTTVHLCKPDQNVESERDTAYSKYMYAWDTAIRGRILTGQLTSRSRRQNSQTKLELCKQQWHRPRRTGPPRRTPSIRRQIALHDAQRPGRRT